MNIKPNAKAGAGQWHLANMANVIGKLARNAEMIIPMPTDNQPATTPIANEDLDALFHAIDTQAERVRVLEEIAKMVAGASMGESRPSRGESFIGWQEGDCGSASEIRRIARTALASTDEAR